MSVVLVTGGSGLLGRKIVPLLRDRGHEVRVLSRRPDGGTHVGNLSVVLTGRTAAIEEGF